VERRGELAAPVPQGSVQLGGMGRSVICVEVRGRDRGHAGKRMPVSHADTGSPPAAWMIQRCGDEMGAFSLLVVAVLSAS
jgi:hypothetical protein